MVISTLLRVCHKTGSFRRNYVLLSGVGGSETSCLDSVGETTQICRILTLEHNSVEMIIFSILHCTESRYYQKSCETFYCIWKKGARKSAFDDILENLH